jgi:DNA-binding transcriptional MerR regulator
MSEWTLGELVDRAGQALATADVRAPNGRVTAVPDGRLIRWYATIGLLDRPETVKGRSMYGPKHLWQLVAIKRLQAQGASLEEIQLRLAGATEAALRAIANVPDSAPLAPVPDAIMRPPAPDGARRAPAPDRAQPVPKRFWTTPPTETSITDAAVAVHGVRIGQLTLLLPNAPRAADLDAIAEAARPLIEVLTAQGLLEGNRP